MNRIERRARRLVDPWSTAWTMRWHGAGLRRVPRPPATSASGAVDGVQLRADRPVALACVPSPGQWVVPPGQRPGWAWLPEQGALPNLRVMPGWVRIWFRLPWLDRYAYSWMWWHGGWAIPVDPSEPPPPVAGVREPRRPLPRGPFSAADVPRAI